jgi:hypothetical protein
MFHRPRFRFSLKSLLLVVIVFSVALASFSVTTARARRQAAAVSKLRSLGATVFYDFHHYYDHGGCVGLDRKPGNWIWARKMLGNDLFSDVYMVEFIEYRDINDHISGRVTTFFGPVETPTTVSQDADKYTPLLESLPNLRHLDLGFSQVSDASIPALEKLHWVEYMRLSHTNISQAGAERLGKSLPNCKIYWQPKRAQ